MSEKVKVRHYIKNSSNSGSFFDNLEEYTAYWRSNPHRFITEYIGGDLYGFQNEMIYTMDKYNYFIYAASRGLAKSTVGAWFAIERAILYPDQQIVVTAYEKGQSSGFISIIDKLKNKYPNLDNEIEDINTGTNNSFVKFKNRSVIKAMTLSGGSRYYRCHILIADEFALFKDKEMLSSVFTPMMTNTRKPIYKSLKAEEVKKYHEPNKELYLSSIRTEMDWSWQYLLQFIDFMCDGDDKYIAFALPYHYGVKHGYITPENVAKQFRENPTNPELIRAEYEAIPLRSDSGAFFKYGDFEKNRTSADVLFAMSDEEFNEYRNKREKWKFFKEKGVKEIRIMSADIALIGGNNNDNTSIHIFRLQPIDKGYKKVLAYSETMNGRHSKEQALRIKQLFYEMECDYLIIDAAGNSISVVEQLMDYAEDINRGITYDPWTMANPDEVKTNKLSISSSALPIMYGLKVSASDNHLIYNNAKRMLENDEVELPIDSKKVVEVLDQRYKYGRIEDTDLRRRLLNTFVQVDMLVMETTNLVTSSTSGNIKLEPKSGRRKDRFTSLVYGLFLIKRLEDEYLASLQSSQYSLSDYIMFV